MRAVLARRAALVEWLAGFLVLMAVVLAGFEVLAPVGAGFAVLCAGFPAAFFALEEPELEGGPDMEGDGDQQGDARPPQEGGERLQRGRVVIDFFGSFVDLEIAEEMADDETEEHEAGDGHNRFFADGGLPEMQAGSRKICRSSAHGMYWSLGLL